MTRRSTPRTADAIRNAYARHGVEAYYAQHGAHYRNPHEDAVHAALRARFALRPLARGRVLDLAAGSGEASSVLLDLGVAALDACDPYTAEAYEKRLGRVCERLSFEQIAAGALEGREYDLVVCSYALHLPAASRLPGICLALARVAAELCLVSPHKRPVLRDDWGWQLLDELVVEGVRVRDYRSTVVGAR